MATLAELLALVDIHLTSDDNEYPQASREQKIRDALREYSRDRPDVLVEDVTGDGTQFYRLDTSLDKWEIKFSQIRQVEYPAVDLSAGSGQPQFLEDDEFEVYRAEVSGSQVDYLRFDNLSPASTETIRITYTARYTFDGGDNTTVPDYAEDAIALLAACKCCTDIAIKYSRTNDATIAVDAINHLGRAAEFSARAAELCRRYQELVGVGEFADAKTTAAFERADLDTSPDWPYGRDYVFRRDYTR